jgi:hypothetical protein
LTGWWTTRTTSDAPARAVRDLLGPVLRPVVDGDDLELVGDRGQRRERLRHQALEVGLLVVRREE